MAAMRRSRKAGRSRTRLPLALAVLCACGGESAGGGAAREAGECTQLGTTATLPAELDESSGLAASRTRPGIYWTHNDAGGEPELYAVDAEGQLQQRVRLDGADYRDWEDIARGPCPAGECLYVGDIGDNHARRQDAAIYRVREPRAGETHLPAERFPLRYPGGPRDAEALFVMPDTTVYIVTKGRESPIALFRYPAPLRAGEVVQLEHVRDFTPGPVPRAERVTAADAAPGGRWIAVRSYSTLMLFRAADLLQGEGAPHALNTDLTPLGEPQGEAVTLGDSGLVALGSERDGGAHATLIRLRCTLR